MVKPPPPSGHLPGTCVVSANQAATLIRALRIESRMNWTTRRPTTAVGFCISLLGLDGRRQRNASGGGEPGDGVRHTLLGAREARRPAELLLQERVARAGRARHGCHGV